jgi:hypothetical protein
MLAELEKLNGPESLRKLASVASATRALSPRIWDVFLAAAQAAIETEEVAG